MSTKIINSERNTYQPFLLTLFWRLHIQRNLKYYEIRVTECMLFVQCYCEIPLICIFTLEEVLSCLMKFFVLGVTNKSTAFLHRSSVVIIRYYKLLVEATLVISLCYIIIVVSVTMSCVICCRRLLQLCQRHAILNEGC